MAMHWIGRFTKLGWTFFFLAGEIGAMELLVPVSNRQLVGQSSEQPEVEAIQLRRSRSSGFETFPRTALHDGARASPTHSGRTGSFVCRAHSAIGRNRINCASGQGMGAHK